MPKVFVCEYIHPDVYAYLKNHAEILTDWEEFPEADAVIDRNFKITEELLKKARCLKVIGIHGAGIDDVDMMAAKARNIEVFSVPHENAQSVAEMNVALMLALGRKLSWQRYTKNGSGRELAKRAELLKGSEFHGKTLGFIGIGDISRRTAKICRGGFGMKLLGWSRHLSEEEAQKLHIKRCMQMNEVFEKSDVVMVGLALEASTKQCIGKEQFDCMKPTSLFINTARGAIVDEAALYQVLYEGRIAGATSDVFCDEPLLENHPLLELDNFIGTPHLGANTDEALKRVGMAVVQGVLERLKNESFVGRIEMAGKTYFIADTHFGDAAMIRYENRPFKDIAEQERILIENWNEIVENEDTVFVLGDFGHSASKEETTRLCQALNGKKILILGNHDIQTPEWYRSCGFSEASAWPIIYENFWILSHEPLYINENMPYANIFGHVHANPMYKDFCRQSFCVSVERIAYRPIAFEDIRKKVLG